MRVDTTRFGVLEVKEEELIKFPTGLPGFPDMRKYVLMENSEGQIFHIMQSVDDPTLAFILVDPALFVADYKVEVDREEVAELQLEGDDTAVIMAIVTVPRDNPRGMTANLQAPIVFNPRTRLGRQVVLSDSPYGVRHPLLATDEGADTETGSPTAAPARAPGTTEPHGDTTGGPTRDTTGGGTENPGAAPADSARAGQEAG